jgi:hypothetical protein
MKVHSFVAPKVATPQQYFMMNAPLVDNLSNQVK